LLKYLFIAPVVDIDGGRIQFADVTFQSIGQGQVWRLVTPILIHFSVLHIFFNMWWLRDLGAAIEFHRGSGRFALLVLAIAVASNVAQFRMSGPAFGGMSGVVFGLFGYIWIKSRTQPESGFYVHPNTAFWVMVWFFLCMTGTVGAIANWAHGVGLIVGLVIGYAPVLWKNAAK
jgi:GlpG protein